MGTSRGSSNLTENDEGLLVKVLNLKASLVLSNLCCFIHWHFIYHTIQVKGIPLQIFEKINIAYPLYLSLVIFIGKQIIKIKIGKRIKIMKG